MHSRYELGSMLITSTDRRDRERGRGLLGEVRVTATKLRLAPLRAAADELLSRAFEAFERVRSNS